MMLNALIDFIFPRTSIISDERLAENNFNEYVRDEEINSLPRVTQNDLEELNSKVTADFTFSVFVFKENNEFSKIIYQLKYGGMKRLGVYLGNLVGIELSKYILSERIEHFDLIIPVPLFKIKLRERGYNQSGFVCKGINEILKINFVPDMIKRVRNTSTQTKLSREQRIENMKDAFVINEKYTEELTGKKVILIDDVVTTGSTMNEIIKVLKENNCGDVLACSLAMAR